MHILKSRDVVVITRQAQTMELKEKPQHIEDFIDASACEPPAKRMKLEHTPASIITSRSVVDRSLKAHQQSNYFYFEKKDDIRVSGC